MRAPLYGLLWLLLTAFPGIAAPAICQDMQRGAEADLRASWENHVFNRDIEGRAILPAFDQAAKLMRAHRWRRALPLLEYIAIHPTFGALQAGLDEAADDLAMLIRHCSQSWLTPNDPDSDDAEAKWFRVTLAPLSTWPRLIFVAARHCGAAAWHVGNDRRQAGANRGAVARTRAGMVLDLTSDNVTNTIFDLGSAADKASAFHPPSAPTTLPTAARM